MILTSKAINQSIRQFSSKQQFGKCHVKTVRVTLGLLTICQPLLYEFSTDIDVSIWKAHYRIFCKHNTRLPFGHCPLNQTGHTSNCCVQIHSGSSLDNFHQKKGLLHPTMNWNKTNINQVELEGHCSVCASLLCTIYCIISMHIQSILHVCFLNKHGDLLFF